MALTALTKRFQQETKHMGIYKFLQGSIWKKNEQEENLCKPNKRITMTDNETGHVKIVIRGF